MKNTIKTLPIVAGSTLMLLATRALAVVDNGDGQVGVPDAINPSGALSKVKPSGASTDLLTNIRVITNTMILFVGIAAVVMLIVGGFQYVFSQGNDKHTKTAKDTIMYSIVGIVIALLAFAVVNFVLSQFTQAPAQ